MSTDLEKLSSRLEYLQRIFLEHRFLYGSDEECIKAIDRRYGVEFDFAQALSMWRLDPLFQYAEEVYKNETLRVLREYNRKLMLIALREEQELIEKNWDSLDARTWGVKQKAIEAVLKAGGLLVDKAPVQVVQQQINNPQELIEQWKAQRNNNYSQWQLENARRNTVDGIVSAKEVMIIDEEGQDAS